MTTWGSNVIPEDLRYTAEHEWLTPLGSESSHKVGITDFAQDSLGDIVFFDPPAVGSEVTAGEGYAEVESVKAVSDVVAPLSGEIIEVNEGLKDSPEQINEDSYGEGWLVKIKLSDPSESDSLMDPESYRQSLS